MNCVRFSNFFNCLIKALEYGNMVRDCFLTNFAIKRRWVCLLNCRSRILFWILLF
jgi:hypothetical protein